MLISFVDPSLISSDYSLLPLEIINIYTLVVSFETMIISSYSYIVLSIYIDIHEYMCVCTELVQKAKKGKKIETERREYLRQLSFSKRKHRV